jgi:hypothetical protein
MRSQPTHADIFFAANELCASTIAVVESELASQVESDAAQELRRREEERVKAEMARIAAECDEREKQDRLKKMEQDQLEIQAAERDLWTRKQALLDAQKGADNHGDNDDDNDNGSVSTPDGQPVCHVRILSLHSQLITM